MCAHCSHVSERDDTVASMTAKLATNEATIRTLKAELAHAHDDVRKLTDHAANIEAELLVRKGMLLCAPTFELGKVDIVRVDSEWTIVGKEGTVGRYPTLEEAWIAAKVLP